jgi:hypothetical protein
LSGGGVTLRRLSPEVEENMGDVSRGTGGVKNTPPSSQTDQEGGVAAQVLAAKGLAIGAACFGAAPPAEPVATRKVCGAGCNAGGVEPPVAAVAADHRAGLVVCLRAEAIEGLLWWGGVRLEGGG